MHDYDQQGAEKNMNLESIKGHISFLNEEKEGQVHALLLQ